MNIERAKQLITILADGVNPLTGEVLPEEDSCNQVEIVRALHKILMSLNEQQKPKKKLPENSGKPWTGEDEVLLCAMFDSGRTNKEICEHFKRTTGAIAARLVKLGKISEREEFSRRKP